MSLTCRWRSIGIAVLCAAVTIGLQADEPKVEVPSYNTMTDTQETAIGREAASEIEKERKLTFVEVPRVQAYISRVVAQLAAQSRRPQLAYSVKVVDTAQINAFALPGGFLYVNRGLIEWARSESELAAVLGHEVGHVVGRHGSNTLSRLSTVDSLLFEASRVLLGDDAPARLLKQVGGPVAFLALMKYSRTDEFQADLLGYYNLQRAGWSPDGMVDLFKHFGERATGIESLMAIGNSHPAPVDREQQIVNEMKKFPPKAGLTRDSAEFTAVQGELKKLPKPRSPAA
jgi:beta-barrel assembly-enhancing protease